MHQVGKPDSVEKLGEWQHVIYVTFKPLGSTCADLGSSMGVGGVLRLNN